MKKIERLMRGVLQLVRARSSRPDKKSAYEANGRVPWSDGYSKYRSSLITRVIRGDELSLFDSGARLSDSYGFKLDERTVEIPWVFARITKANSILDAGCAFFKYAAARDKITPDTKVALIALDTKDMEFKLTAGKVDRIPADLRHIPLSDETFDTAICISTIEHVGMDNTQLYTSNEQFRESNSNDYLKVVAELARVLKKGGDLLMTVPYGKFSKHGWLQVFDGAMLDNLTAASDCVLIEETIYLHGKRGWQLSDRVMSKNAVYFDVHSQANLVGQSNLAAAEAVACLHLRRL